MTPHSPLPTPRDGFSLVELLVVVFIIALMAGVAVLALPGDGAVLDHEVDVLAARAAAARDLAVTSGTSVALVVGPVGHALEQRRDGAWQSVALDRRGLVAWRAGTRFAPADGIDRVRLAFDPLGLPAADTTLRLARGHALAMLRVTRDGRIVRDAH